MFQELRRDIRSVGLASSRRLNRHTRLLEGIDGKLGARRNAGFRTTARRMKWRTLDTKKGVKCRVLEGGSGAPLSTSRRRRPAERQSVLDALAQRHSVFARSGRATANRRRRAARGHAGFLAARLGRGRRARLTKPNNRRPSWADDRGGDGVVSPRDSRKLVLGAGGSVDRRAPDPDVFAMLPFEIANIMFAIRRRPVDDDGRADLSDIEELKDYYIASKRRLADAARSCSRFRTGACRSASIG